MNIRKMTTGDVILWPSEIDRYELRKLQDEILAICERRGFNMELPISDIQYGAPTANQLKAHLWPDYLPSMRAFLESEGPR